MGTSLYNLSQQTLTVSLLKLRSTVSNRTKSDTPGTFSFPELAERIKVCNGIEVIHLVSALPHSGLRPDLLEFLEYNHPMMSPFLEKFWKEVCVKEFPRSQPDHDESWINFYHRQLDSSKSKIQEAGTRLRDSYRGEERKVHQLKSIAAPIIKRPRISSSAGKTKNLMEKSWQEALNSSSNKNTNRSTSNKPIVTFRMKQPSQKR